MRVAREWQWVADVAGVKRKTVAVAVAVSCCELLCESLESWLLICHSATNSATATVLFQ
jgi:hypothetical protein